MPRDRASPLPTRAVQGVHRLAVDVELQLIRCTVPNVHRRRSPISLEVIQRLLVKVGRSVDPVHDLERPRGLPGPLADAIPQPAEEGQRLVRVAETEQRVNGKRRVAYPREPVVPVALATDLLGQARRGSGHDAPVGAYVISLSVIAERLIASRQRPVYVERPSQPRQNRTVSLNRERTRSASIGAAASLSAPDSRIAPPTSPARIVHRARTSLPSGWSSTVARSARSISSVSKMKPSPTARSRCSALPVEARLALEDERHLSADDAQDPDQLVTN